MIFRYTRGNPIGVLSIKLKTMPTLLRPAGLLLSVLLLTIPADAATYHVSSSDGDDANPGTEAAPWRSLAKVNATPFTPGDSILLRRGDTWTGGGLVVTRGGTSDTARITYGAYGAGAKPVIDVHGVAGGGVTANNVDYLTIQNLDIRNANHAGGQYTGVTCTNIHQVRVLGVEVRNTSGAGLNFSQGGFLLVDGCTATQTGGGAFYFRGSAVEPLHDVEVANCTAHDLNGKADGFTLHQKSVPGNPGLGRNFHLHDNTAYGCREQGFDLTSGSFILLERNQSHDNDLGAFDIGHTASDVTIRHHTSANEPAVNSASTLKISAPRVTVEYSTFTGSRHFGRPLVVVTPSINRATTPHTTDGQPEDVVLRNNVFLWNTAAGGVIFSLTRNASIQDGATLPFKPTLRRLTLQNNIFSTTTAIMGVLSFRDLAAPLNSAGFAIDHNVYHTPEPAGPRWTVEGQDRDFAAYRAAFGQDAHGLAADPRFVDPAAGDYRLRPGSPAIDAGENTGLDRDGAGTAVPQGRARDIGALEYTGNLRSPAVDAAPAPPTSLPDQAKR